MKQTIIHYSFYKRKHFSFFIIFSLLISCVSLSMKAQSVFINEISICNISHELDPNYDYSGWIELYNASDINVELKYLYYSDEQGKPQKYKLNALRTLPAKGYASIWMNDEVSLNNGFFFGY